LLTNNINKAIDTICRHKVVHSQKGKYLFLAKMADKPDKDKGSVIIYYRSTLVCPIFLDGVSNL